MHQLIFMCLMNNLFNQYLDKLLLVLLDDILIYSKNEDEQEDHLRMYLEVLREHHLYVLGICYILCDPGHAQVHDGDKSQLNELSVVIVEAYKKNKKSKKYTGSTESMRANNMQEFEPIYYFFSMKDGGIIMLYITLVYMLI